MMYRGTADLGDGQQACMEGTLQQCANWAENVIRNHEGGITITIERIAAA